MAYEGVFMDQCPRVPYNWHYTYAVVVSGSGPNPCGHALLNVGGHNAFGYYFHLAGVYKRPYFMDRVGYDRYIKENKKTELVRTWMPINNPDGAQEELERLTAKPWLSF